MGFHNILMLEIKNVPTKLPQRDVQQMRKVGEEQCLPHSWPIRLWDTDTASSTLGRCGWCGFCSYPSCNRSKSIKQSLFTLRDPKSSLLVNLSSFPPDPHRHFSVWSLTFHISSNLLASYLYWSLNLIINQLQMDFSSSFSLPQLLGYF